MSTYSQTTVRATAPAAAPVAQFTVAVATAVDDMNPFAYTHPLCRITTEMTHALPVGTALKRCPRVDDLHAWFTHHRTTPSQQHQQAEEVYHQPAFTLGDTFRGLEVDALPKTWNPGYFNRHGIPPFAIRRTLVVPPSTPELVPSVSNEEPIEVNATVDLERAFDSTKLEAVIAIEEVDTDTDTEDAVQTSALEVDEEGHPVPTYATAHTGETSPRPQLRKTSRDSLTSIHSTETVVTLASDSDVTTTDGCGGSGTNSAGSVTPTTPPKPVLVLANQTTAHAVEVHKALKAELIKACTARNYRYRYRSYGTQGEGSANTSREGTPEAENAIQVSTPPELEEVVVDAALLH